ncbi:MAG TPA: MBL fold metallo-hydrolase [Bacillota bacterium]|jgi:phosphoribosyl 1,2-cyclic phosphodiesterase|nr:MBL fold metallo-hydrolase [Bacillota bacterium]
MTVNNFTVTFWGVRGSRPVPGPGTVIYGGNTPCVEVRIGKRLIILDAGTGITNLGFKLMQEPGPVRGDIFITHVHWDHIQGFPFFLPAFKRGNSFNIYGEGKEEITFEALIRRTMRFPNFPVPLENLGAAMHFKELKPGDVIDIRDGITVHTVANSHPDGGVSYRIQYGEKSCCYVTDYEHGSDKAEGLIRLCEGTDLLIYDSYFTDAEYPAHKGWGHSTWEEGLALQEKAGVRQLLLFHHKPERSDEEMAALESKIIGKHPMAKAAREGMVVSL